MEPLKVRGPRARYIEGAGTDESSWLGDDRIDDMVALDVERLAADHPVAWIVAPHPDDEILGVGGLMATLAKRGTTVRVVSVTDGTASHPGSSRWTPDVLAATRPRELQAALRALGPGIETTRLGIRDGDVAVHVAEIESFVAARCRAEDLLLTTWRLDGHPDHEACGRAVVAAAARLKARVLEYPVWAWHWASPASAEFPWQRARRIGLDDDLWTRKSLAIGQFASQLAWDDQRAPVVPARALVRFRRSFEVVFA